MNKPSSNGAVSTEEIAEQAAQWVEKMDKSELSSANNQLFLIWLRKSPLHVNEFIHACVLSDATELVEQYKDIAAEVSWSSKAQRRQFAQIGENGAQQSKSSARSAAKWFYALAAFAVLFLAISVYLNLPDLLHNSGEVTTAGSQYSTALGEQKNIMLNDGTLVNMNTLTNINVQYSESFRDVILLSGEAIFNVAHQPDRPLRVWSNNTVAQASGSEFNVRSRVDDTGWQTRFTVISGNVAVDNEKWLTAGHKINSELNLQNSASAVHLSQGEEAVFDQSGLAKKQNESNLAKRLSWTQKKLIFNGETLKQVASEFNRYNKTQIEITDKKAATLAISGVFTSHNPDTLIEFLQSSGELEVNDMKRNRIVVKSAD